MKTFGIVQSVKMKLTFKVFRIKGELVLAYVVLGPIQIYFRYSKGKMNVWR